MFLAKLEKTLLFLTLLFLPTQLGRHFWPNFSFVYSLSVDYLSPTIYFWDFLILGLLFVFIIQRKPVKGLALNLFLLFFLSQVLSLLPQLFDGHSLNLGAGLVRAEQYLIAGLFGVYLASVNIKRAKATFIRAISISVLAESLIAVLQFIKGETLGLWILGERSFSLSTPGIAKFDFYGTQFLRPYATFPHPNVLAAFLILSCLILSLKELSIDSWLKRIISFVSGLVVLMTVSRTAIISGLLSAWVLLGKKGRVLLLVLILVFLPILYTRFSAVFNFDNLSLIRREQLSQASLKLWSTSKLLGVGLNNFIPFSSQQVVVGPSRFLQPVHNIFLLALSETGFIGLMGLIGLISYPMVRLFKLYPKPLSLKSILIIWLVIIFLGMFDHYFLTLPQGYRMLFLVWGLSLSVLE